jgi:hypothetical protein
LIPNISRQCPSEPLSTHRYVKYLDNIRRIQVGD